MSVVTRPFSGFHGIHSNDRLGQNNFVFLRDTDRVRDEDRFVKTQLPDVTVEHSPLSDDAWSGLEVGQTLGQLITTARKSRSLSREQVAEQTSTPAYYIRMIESDCYDAIPDQLYLLPFFERYANFLGLDAPYIVARFIREFEKAEAQIELVPTPAAPAPAAPSGLQQRWRRIAEVAAIVGILLPIVGWEIGTMRAVYHRQVTAPSRVAISSAPRPSPAIMTSAAPTDAAAPVEAQMPTQIAATANPGAASPVQAQARTRRRAHAHQTSRRLRRLKRRIS